MSDASAAAEVRVICGPTAAGKSEVALWLAQQAPCVIVSADSRQIYREFDIGTAKPSAGDQARVPHVGIDVVSPLERYSAAAWRVGADRWIEETLMANRRPLVVGGTGLYLRAVFDGLFAEPPMDATQRAHLTNALSAMSVDDLRRWVRVLDPARADLGRAQLLRAVEVALLTGRRVSNLHREQARPSRWRARYLVVDPGPALAERIGARIDAMLDHGWADEVQRLMQTVPATAPAWNATGYDAVRRFVTGDASAAETRETILIATRQYAKRQRTWFRHQLPAANVTHFDPTTPGWRDVAVRWAAFDATEVTA